MHSVHSTKLQPTQVVEAELKRAFRGHPAGVSVVTADGRDGPVGLTATSLSSVSLTPAVVMLSVSALSSSTPAILGAETAMVHLLDEQSLHIAQLCATSGIDRFADTRLWSRAMTGEPIFHDARARLRVRPLHKIDATTSTVIVAEVLDIALLRDEERIRESSARALVYHAGEWHALSDASRIA